MALSGYICVQGSTDAKSLSYHKATLSSCCTLSRLKGTFYDTLVLRGALIFKHDVSVRDSLTSVNRYSGRYQ